jgi:nucleotide-binding universal stress UspA family protein
VTDEEDMQEDSPEDGAQVFRRILVGLDGSEGSQRALAWATRAAAMAGAEVLAVHVLTPSREMRVDLSPTGHELAHRAPQGPRDHVDRPAA